MKIAIVCRRYSPEIGGIETHVKEIAERLARKHEIIVFTLVSNKKLSVNEIINGVSVRRFKSLKFSYSVEFAPFSMLREIEKFDPDIIHSHSAHTTIPFFASKAKCNSKFVITAHYQGNATTAFRRILFMVYKPFLISAMSRADRIICVSPVERDMLVNGFAIDQGKIRMIPNGVGSDLANIARGHRDQLRILSVGRFDLHHKKTDKLIRAFKILESRIEAKLVLVGSGPDKHEIIKLIKALDLDEKVELKSDLTREELVQEYSNAQIFVTASEQEAFGIAVAEALAARLKVVVPNSTALSMYVSAGCALGIEVPVTPEKIAESVMQCIQKTTRLQDYSPHTWDMVTSHLEKVYRELAEKNC